MAAVTYIGSAIIAAAGLERSDIRQLLRNVDCGTAGRTIMQVTSVGLVERCPPNAMPPHVVAVAVEDLKIIDDPSYAQTDLLVQPESFVITLPSNATGARTIKQIVEQINRP